MPAITDIRPPIRTMPVDSGRDPLHDDALRDTFPASDPVAITEPGPATPERPVVRREVQARQGVTGHNVRYVLGWGLAGTVIAFAVIYLIYNL